MSEDRPGTLEWYVVHTYSGYENKVKDNLEKAVENNGMQNLIQEVVVPTEEVVEIKNGKRVTSTRKTFPGYVLVRMIITNESWYVVRNTRGVTGFVGPESKPIPLTADELNRMLGRFLWLSEYLLERGMHHKVRALTGSGTLCLPVTSRQELEKALDTLLCAPRAAADAVMEDMAASWQYRIGGGEDEGQ